MKKWLNITTEEKDKKDVEKLFKLAEEIKKQQQIIKKATAKICEIQENYSINKYSLTDADDDLLIRVDTAKKILIYGHDF